MTNEKKNFLLRKRSYISLLIWFGNVFFWIVAFIYKGININEARSLSLIFWILFLSAFAIQAVPYWLILDRNFKGRRPSNIALLKSMPLFIFLGIWVFLLFGGVLTPTGGGFK